MPRIPPIPFVVICVVTTACGASTSFVKKDSTSADKTRVSWPGNDVHGEADGVFTGFDPGPNGIAGSGKPSQRVWLNFEGAHVVPDAAPILTTNNVGPVDVPAFNLAPGKWDGMGLSRAQVIEQIVAKLGARFADIGLSFSVMPPEKPFTTLHVGGHNFTGRPGVAGVSPLDVGNFHNEDVAFVFSDDIKDDTAERNLEVLVNVMAHELGHSFGTRHIDNKLAIMNPVLFLESSDFDKKGPYVGEKGEENSKEVLLANLGTPGAAAKKTTPPDIPSLAVASAANVGQYSVLSLANIRANPEHQLSDFSYAWAYEGKTAEGMAVRIRFDDETDHELALTVTHEGTGESAQYKFIVGRKPQ